LNTEKAKGLSGYQNDGGLFKIFGDCYFPEGNLLFCNMNEAGKIPAEAVEKGAFEFISAIYSFNVSPYRERGVYKLDTAQATLDYSEGRGKETSYFLMIQAKKMEDLKKLYHQIRTGTIRPSESYEAEQGGKAGEELEQELGLAKLRIKELEKTQSSVHVLLINLHTKVIWGWPLCWKQSIRRAINEIIIKVL
jgi:hypothetical protein